MLPKSGDRYTANDLQRVIDEKLTESDTLEYKADPAGRLEAVLAKAVTAFANAGGGNLVLGIAETPSGEPTPADPPGMPPMLGTVPVEEQVDRLIRTKVVPNPPATVESVDVSGSSRKYVIVTVSPRGGGPYRIAQTNDPALNGRYYVRRGRDSVEADHYQLRALFAEAEDAAVRVRQYLERRGLADETSPDFGQRPPLRYVATMTWKNVDHPPQKVMGDHGAHAVVAAVIPDVLRGPVVDTMSAAVRDAIDPGKVSELRGFGHRQEPTLEGRWLVQRVTSSPQLGSYVEVHRSGYVEVSHSAAAVRYGDGLYIDAGAALLIAKAAIAVASRIRGLAKQGDDLLVGLFVRHANTARLFAYDPENENPSTTLYEHLRIELVADERALAEPLGLLRQFDERLGNAYGRDRSGALTDDGQIDRIYHPLDGRW